MGKSECLLRLDVGCPDHLGPFLSLRVVGLGSKREGLSARTALPFVLRRRIAVDVALGRYPAAGFARVGPDRLELARRIENKKAQLAVVCSLEMVPLASAEIDHIARLYRFAQASPRPLRMYIKEAAPS